MLSDLDAIMLITKKINNIKLLFLFLKNDCKINIEYQTFSDGFVIGAIKLNIIYNDNKIEAKGYFTNSSVENAITFVFSILSDEDKDKVKNQIVNFGNETEDKVKNKDKISLTINNNLSNMVSIKVETYSDLRSFVENNTNIENKTEIVNLIRELEEAKEDENKEDYIDKFLELLELLGNVIPIPPAIIKGAKTAKKFFDSIRGKNEK